MKEFPNPFAKQTPQPKPGAYVQRVRRKRESMDDIMDRMGARDRQPPSGVLLTIDNPGNKLISYLGKPVKQKKFKVESHGSQFTCAHCTFDLPQDWVLCDPPEGGERHNETIVAKQNGTGRVVRVLQLEHLSMSEVLG